MGPGPRPQITRFARATPLCYIGNFRPYKLGPPLDQILDPHLWTHHLHWLYVEMKVAISKVVAKFLDPLTKIRSFRASKLHTDFQVFFSSIYGGDTLCLTGVLWPWPGSTLPYDVTTNFWPIWASFVGWVWQFWDLIKEFSRASTINRDFFVEEAFSKQQVCSVCCHGA